MKKHRTDFVILSQKIAGEADEILQSRNPWQSRDGQKERKNKCQTEDEKFRPFNCVNLREAHLDKGNFKTELEAKKYFRIQSTSLRPGFPLSHHNLKLPRVILTRWFRRRASCSGSGKSSSKRTRTPCRKSPRGEQTFLRGALKFQMCYQAWEWNRYQLPLHSLSYTRSVCMQSTWLDLLRKDWDNFVSPLLWKKLTKAWHPY